MKYDCFKASEATVDFKTNIHFFFFFKVLSSPRAKFMESVVVFNRMEELKINFKYVSVAVFLISCNNAPATSYIRQMAQKFSGLIKIVFANNSEMGRPF